MQNQMSFFQDSALSPSERASVLIREGRQQFSQNEVEAARASFKEAASLDPARRDVWLCLASVSSGAEQAEYLRRARQAARIKQETTRDTAQPIATGKRTTRLIKDNTLLIMFASAGLLLVVILAAASFFVYQRFFGPSNRPTPNGEQVIQASQGGKINLEGQAALFVPPGSLFDNQTFTLRFVESEKSFPENSLLVPVGKTVAVETKAGLLRQPVWVGIRYNPASLPQGVKENSLQVARWDGQSWEQLPTILNTAEKIVYVQIYHFSTAHLRIIGVAPAVGSSSFVQQIEQINQQFYQDDFDPAVIGQYEQLLSKFSTPQQLAAMTELEKKSYWMALNLWGTALLRNNQYENAGQVFEYCVRVALQTQTNTWDNQLITSPGYALNMLQNYYPLGVKTAAQLRAEGWGKGLSSNLWSLNDDKYATRVMLASDLTGLPQSIQQSIASYEAAKGLPSGKGVLTSVSVLVLSPQAQAAVEQSETLARSVIPFVQSPGIETISTASLKNPVTAGLGSQVQQLLQKRANSNVYVSDAVSPGEDRHSYAPLFLLRVERVWQGTNGLTHTQHLFSLSQAGLGVGEPLADVLPEDTGYQLANGKLTQTPRRLAWLKIGDAETKEIKAVQVRNEQILAVGGYHACTLTKNNGVQCWGSNEYGQLGTGREVTSSETPRDVTGLNLGFRQVAAGENHTCALSLEGRLFCWGKNNQGQVGSNTRDTQYRPVEVVGFDGKVTAVTAGKDHTCATTITGSLYCWGSNSSGQLGAGKALGENSLQPMRVNALDGVKAAAAGAEHTCAVLDGAVKCWGSNADGQLGNNTQVDSDLPVDVQGLSDIVMVTAGIKHTCALNSRGGVMCWGANISGQLGTGSGESNVLTPVDVKDLQSGAITVRASSTGYHTCAVVDAGILCWGANVEGQIGNGSPDQILPAPTQVKITGERFVSLGVGRSFSCARTDNGLVYCWGDNRSGQLGQSNRASGLLPAAVAGFGTILADSTGHIEISPSTDNGIELGDTLKIRDVNLDPATKTITILVSYNGQPFEQIFSGAPAEMASWSAAGKELGKKVQIKLVTEDAQKKKTEYTSNELTLKDTRLPTAVIAIDPPAKVIELGDSITFQAKEVSDSVNNITGSGVKELVFQVVENDTEFSDPVTIAFSAEKAMQIIWPAPLARKRNNTRVAFQLTVVDKAGNEYKIEDKGYSLADRLKANFVGEVAVQADPPSSGDSIEMGASAAVTVNVNDTFENGKQGSGIRDVSFYVSTDGAGAKYDLINHTTFGDEGTQKTVTSNKWSSKGVPYGQVVYFKAVVRDVAGNTTEKVSSRYKMGDTTSPSANASMSGATNPLTTKTVTFTVGGITDGDGAGLASAEFSATCNGKALDAASFKTATVPAPGAEISNTLTLPDPSAACGYGHSILISMILKDKSSTGNPKTVQLSPALTYNYDVTKPTATAAMKVTNPVITQAISFTVSGVADPSDGAGSSGVATAEFSATCNGTALPASVFQKATVSNPAAQIENTLTLPAPSASCGYSHTIIIRVKLTDKATPANSDTITLTPELTHHYDVTKPTVKLAMTDVSDPVTSQTFSFTVESVQDVSDGAGAAGVALVEFSATCNGKPLSSSAFEHARLENPSQTIKNKLTLPAPSADCGYGHPISISIKVTDKATPANADTFMLTPTLTHHYDATLPTASTTITGITNPVTTSTVTFKVNGITDPSDGVGASGVDLAEFSARCNDKDLPGSLFEQQSVKNPGDSITQTFTLPNPSTGCGWDDAITISMKLTDKGNTKDPNIVKLQLAPDIINHYDVTPPTVDPTMTVTNPVTAQSVPFTVNGIADINGIGVASAAFSATCNGNPLPSSVFKNLTIDTSSMATSEASVNISNMLTLPPPSPTCGYTHAVVISVRLTDKNNNSKTYALEPTLINNYDVTPPTADAAMAVNNEPITGPVSFKVTNIHDISDGVGSSGVASAAFSATCNGVPLPSSIFANPIISTAGGDISNMLTLPAQPATCKYGQIINISVTVTDQAGNPATIPLTPALVNHIDKIEPTANSAMQGFTNPVKTQTIPFTVTGITDPTDGAGASGVATAEFSAVCHNTALKAADFQYPTVSTPPSSINNQLTLPVPDQYCGWGDSITIKVKLTDQAGNSQTITLAPSLTYAYDDTAPSVNQTMGGVSSPVTTQTVNFIVSGITDGYGSGVESAAFSATCNGIPMDPAVLTKTLVPNPGPQITNTLTIPAASPTCVFGDLIVISVELKDKNNNTSITPLAPTLKNHYNGS